MGKFAPQILLFVLLISSSYAAPKEEDAAASKDVAAPAAAASAPKAAATEREVSVVNEQSWLDLLTSSTLLYGPGVVGVVLIFGGLFVGYQYYVYQTSLDVSNTVGYPGQPNAANGQYYAGYNQYPTASGRALDLSSWNVNWAKVIDYIDIARETYEGFDWQNLECQKRVLCEISQGKTAGETGRKITNNYMLMVADALEGFPMPRVVTFYMNEYREAVTQGKNGKRKCGEIYKKCEFSIDTVFAKVNAKKAT